MELSEVVTSGLNLNGDGVAIATANSSSHLATLSEFSSSDHDDRYVSELCS